MNPDLRELLRVAAMMAVVSGSTAHALDVVVQDPQGKPVELVMVTIQPTVPAVLNRSDNGYAPTGLLQQGDRWETAFTGPDGRTHFELGTTSRPFSVRARKPGQVDVTRDLEPGAAEVVLTMSTETDPLRLAEAKPANTWASALDLGSPDANRHFRKQCTFCHQQGLPAMRADRPDEAWAATIERMIRYGSRLPSSVQRAAPAALRNSYRALAEDPRSIPEPRPWEQALTGVRMQEWPIGDATSQMHDMLIHRNGSVYVGDNLQDRMYQVDPRRNTVTVFKTPRSPGDTLGGLFAARLAAFPRHETYTSIHSFAVSEKDGHIFLTPSTQRRMIEFAPDTRAFTVHELDDGLYPHTTRIDAQDRVWFTLALSNQVGMLDRATGKQVFLDLPTRSTAESVKLHMVPGFFALAAHGLPISRLEIDDGSTGVPLPYGIDVAPDGDVYVARLHANDIIHINGKTLECESIPFPADGPRRLRTDAEGNVWITAFGDSSIVRYSPKDRAFKVFPMPTEPVGSDVPYSLNVDKKRRIVWVTGTASDTLMAFHMDTGTWNVFPLPRRGFFTRDIEVDSDGSVYSSNGAFAAWLSEGAQPTLIRIIPPWTDTQGAAGGTP